MLYNLDPTLDRNIYNPEPHYRIYHPRDRGVTIVCVQDFDYRDYDYSRFVSYDSFVSEESARTALDTLRGEILRLLGAD